MLKILDIEGILTLQIVRVQLEPADLEALVKYVQFSDMVPSPQLFSKTQHTPKLEAQDPEEDPLKKNRKFF